MVHDPETYAWSSHCAYAGLKDFAWLTHDLVSESFGDEVDVARKTLREYVCADDESAKEEMAAIRKSLRCGAYGDPGFVEERNKHPASVCSWALSEADLELTLDHLILATCNKFHVTLSELQSDSRGKRYIQARTALALLAKNLQVADTTQVARSINRDPTSLGRLVKKGRQDPVAQEAVRGLRQDLMVT